MSDDQRASRVSTDPDDANRLAQALRSSLLAAAIAAVIAFVAFGLVVGDSTVVFRWMVMAALLAGSGCYIVMAVVVRRGSTPR